MNQQVHFDLLPIRLSRPARGGFLSYRGLKNEADEHPASFRLCQQRRRMQTPKVPGAANATFRDSLSPVFATVWMTAGAFAAEWWGSVMSSTDPAVATIERLSPARHALRDRARPIMHRSHAAQKKATIQWSLPDNRLAWRSEFSCSGLRSWLLLRRGWLLHLQRHFLNLV